MRGVLGAKARANSCRSWVGCRPDRR